jgi:hypothetical protein
VAHQTTTTISSEMRQCIDECTRCHAICLETVGHCLGLGGKHADPGTSAYCWTALKSVRRALTSCSVAPIFTSAAAPFALKCVGPAPRIVSAWLAATR